MRKLRYGSHSDGVKGRRGSGGAGEILFHLCDLMLCTDDTAPLAPVYLPMHVWIDTVSPCKPPHFSLQDARISAIVAGRALSCAPLFVVWGKR